MSWHDLREWMAEVEALGELRVVAGATWQEEIGGITEMLDHTPNSPCVLFDKIPGYPAGWRVIVNCNGTPRRQAVTLGMPPYEASHEALFVRWRQILEEFQPVPPEIVKDGPVLENSLEGGQVDLELFPAPLWHPKDGGRFIGTASINIMRDPDSGWVNLGTYRNQILGPDKLGIWISPGKHGRTIREKYFERGQKCPIVVLVGSDPLLFWSACVEGIPYGLSEFDWVGGVQRRPVKVIKGPMTGLPIPVGAEIAIEGFMIPGEMHVEGPYGEWTGYYASGTPTVPVIQVVAIHYRDDPIILGCPQGKPPHEDNQFLAYLKSALIQKQIEAAGVSGVSGVWCPPEGGSLRAAAATPDLAAKEQALLGSTMANLACGNAKLGLVHLLNRPVNTLFPAIPYGQSIGTLLLPVMAFNLPASIDRFASMAEALGEQPGRGPNRKMAERCLVALKQLLIDLQMDRRYPPDIVDAQAIPRMARMCVEGMHGGMQAGDGQDSTIVKSFNRRQATVAEVMRLYEQACEGWEV